MHTPSSNRRRGPHAAMLAGLATLVAGSGGARAERPVAGSVTSERLKIPSGPNSVRGLAGEPTIDPFAAKVGYEVPLELPTGFGGLAPAIALSYSGALGNGPIGIGWTLAQPRIQRATRLGPPTWTTADELEMSGIANGRLVAISDTEYRVEAMGQTVRVKRVGAGFEVDDGKGTKYRLGTAATARQQADDSHVLAWLCEDATNQAGEHIRYQHLRDQGQIYPSKLTWGPGDVYQVDFLYEARPDITRSFREGFEVKTAKRLTTIKITAFGVERRAYQLAYAPPTSFPLSRLAGVSSTGKAGAGAWPALAFTYAQPAAPVREQIAVGNWRLNDSGVSLVDLDGDGAAELLRLADTGHSYRTNRDGVFLDPLTLTGNSQSIGTLQLQDVDGDARPELLEENTNGWTIYKFSRTQWIQQSGVWPGTQGVALRDPTRARYSDLNGDGLVDAIQWNNNGLLVRWASRTGLSAQNAKPAIGGAVLPTLDGRFHDVNGDGLDDYVVVQSNQLETYIGHGDGTFEPMAAVAYPVTGVWSRERVELGDLDRDGLMDLLRVDDGVVTWFRGRANGSFDPAGLQLSNPESFSSATVVVAIADSNGNGSQDIVWSSPSGMWRMDMAGTTTAGMLTGVNNGIGMEVSLDYRSSHSLSAAARAAGSAWTLELPVSMPVPVQKRTVIGPGEVARLVSYGVRDGFWDAAEQRFGGFLTTTVTTAGATPAETGVVITRYLSGSGSAANPRVWRGKPQTEQVTDGTGKRLSLTNYTWSSMVVSGLPDVPLLRAAILTKKTVLHEESSPARQIQVTYEYDAFGRARRETSDGRADLTGDESVKDTTYADDDATWIRDQVCERKISSTAGVIASYTQHLFGDETPTAPTPCVVGKGWPRETRAWLAQENRFVSQTQTTYNAHGSPISIITNGTETRLTYDATGLFIEDEHHVDAATGTDFVWHAAWDKTLGLATSITEPNGHVNHLRYDALGRFTGSAIDDRPDHQVIEYDWTAPNPKPATWSPTTTTWQFDGASEQLAARPATWSPTSHWRLSVEVSNGLGEVRYRAQRLAVDRWIISDYRERDPNSRVVFAGRPVYASTSAHASRPADIVGDQLRYDAVGRLIQQTTPTGAQRTIDYVSFEQTTHASDLAPVHSVIDGQGRTILTERSLPDGTHEVVEASYDAADRLVTMKLAGGAIQRAFTYDTLGRLRTSQDPDLGLRSLTWDDAARLTSETNAAGQTVTYDYDGLGRLRTRNGGGLFVYHYDAARPGAGSRATNLAGRLAWIEEPTGGLDAGYDAQGRQVFSRRRIDSKTSEVSTVFSPSGLALSRSYDDGFVMSYAYDPAGRLTAIGDLWQLLDQDASGAPLHELAHNGVDTRYDRDVLSLTRQVTLRDVDGAAIYDARAERNGWNAITTITDLDGVGLDHRATFGYDGFARLTSAAIGSGASGFRFGYGYDALQNMTSRTLEPPRSLGAFFGTHHYAERGRAPRQLTSITNAPGQVTHTFDYDAAGRQTHQDELVMTYDPADRLVRVQGLPGGTVEHAYGHDAHRVKTIAPGGATSYFFGDGTAERNGVREHDITVGDRVVARVALPSTSAAATAAVGRTLRFVASFVPWLLAFVALAFALISTRRLLRRRAIAAGMAGLAFAASCASPGVDTARQALDAAAHATFMHVGFSAGPALFTDGTGHLVEERRYEPFGTPIDAQIHSAAGDVIGSPDVAARDLSPLNKRTEVATGWADHDARWLAPETARWLTPDPPVTGPDAQFMKAPWALHPYQYGNQNPVTFWDPDGRNPLVILGWFVQNPDKVEEAITFGLAVVGTAIAATVAAGLRNVADMDPDIGQCGGDAQCTQAITMGKMWAAERERTAVRAQARANAKADAERKAKEPAPYRMRVQVQQKTNNLSSIAIASDKPITGIQVVLAFMQAISELPSGYNKNMDKIWRANDAMRDWVYNTSLSGGVSQGGNVHREWAKDTDIRLDLENLSGHNLREP